MHKKMQITLANKSKLKQEMDQMLKADYQLLNQREDIPNKIQKCQAVHRNDLIQEYIQVVQAQYNIPNPLRYKQRIQSSKTSLYKTLNMSLRNSNHLQQRQPATNTKHKKRLTITSKLNSSADKKYLHNPETNLIIKTPKFGKFQDQKAHEVMMESKVVEIYSTDNQKNRVILLKRKSSRFQIELDLKEKQKITPKSNPVIISLSKIEPINKTPKKQYPNLQLKQEQSLISLEKEVPQRRTLKKHARDSDSEDQHSRSQLTRTVIHKNPINDKLQTQTKIQGQKIRKIKETYRYCVGCELPVLQANIKLHEKQCGRFLELNKLTDQELYQKLRQKLHKIQEKIIKTQSQLHSGDIQHFRSRSMSLVKQSKSRRQCSPQSDYQRQNYEGVMQIGRKWSSAVEEINKLRWFTRIVQKLEKMLQTS